MRIPREFPYTPHDQRTRESFFVSFLFICSVLSRACVCVDMEINRDPCFYDVLIFKSIRRKEHVYRFSRVCKIYGIVGVWKILRHYWGTKNFMRFFVWYEKILRKSAGVRKKFGKSKNLHHPTTPNKKWHALKNISTSNSSLKIISKNFLITFLIVPMSGISSSNFSTIDLIKIRTFFYLCYSSERFFRMEFTTIFQIKIKRAI